MGTFPQKQSPSEVLGTKQFQSFIDAALSFKNNSSWKGDKRLFITLRPNENSVTGLGISNYDYVIRTKITGSYNNTLGAQITNNLAELSTGEIVGHVADANPPYFLINEKYKLNQSYNSAQFSTISVFNTSVTPPIFTSGSYVISQMNDQNPSLLLELDKINQLPNGIGTKQFVVIPENLHPFIKDNLLYFLTRAGIDVGGNTSPLINLDETNRNLP